MALPQDQIHLMRELTLQLQSVVSLPVIDRGGRDLTVQTANETTYCVCVESNGLIYG